MTSNDTLKRIKEEIGSLIPAANVEAEYDDEAVSLLSELYFP